MIKYNFLITKCFWQFLVAVGDKKLQGAWGQPAALK